MKEKDLRKIIKEQIKETIENDERESGLDFLDLTKFKITDPKFTTWSDRKFVYKDKRGEWYLGIENGDKFEWYGPYMHKNHAFNKLKDFGSPNLYWYDKSGTQNRPTGLTRQEHHEKYRWSF